MLEGMRVLDFSAWRPMPHGTQILADLGAEVLKVEPPGGDPMRAYPEIFASVARGKRSVMLDLRSPTGHRRASELAAEADVVCESWRPGVADRLGLGYEAIAKSNPAVIYCSLSGYGQAGPLTAMPGHDLNFQALGGALGGHSGSDWEPEIPRLPVADLEGGTLCALLICAAWARRSSSGAGERIDVSMADVVAWWVGPRSNGLRRRGVRPAGSPGYGLFRTRDDRWIALGALSEQHLWDAICGALGLEHLEGLSFEERLARTEEVNDSIGAVIASLDRDVAIAQLEALGAPVSPVLFPDQISEHPHFQAHDLFVRTTSGAVVVSLPAALSNDSLIPSDVIPGINEHAGFSSRPRP